MQGAGKLTARGPGSVGREEILRCLEDLLASPAFHSSQRSCQFLRYVVETALAGDLDALKERIIGERVFNRPPDYDTGQDSIVRVKANEVRRRLAQYYDLHPDSRLRIELPAGSYLPVFYGPPAAPAPEPPASPISGRRVAAWLVLGSVALIAAAWLVTRTVHEWPLFSRFWEPFLENRSNLIVCAPAPETYRIYGDRKEYLVDALRPRPPGEPAPDIPSEQIRGVQIVPETGLFLGMGDAHTLTLLYAFAAGYGRTPQIRVGAETSFTELRAGPGILIGGFTNRWSVDLMKDARYGFDSEGAVYGIRDRSTGKFICQKHLPWEPPANEDCAVITRLPASKTGQPLLIAAGLDHFGTFEVGEFLTHPKYLEAALKQAPAGWQSRNLQIVFRIEILRDNVGPPTVLATYTW